MLSVQMISPQTPRSFLLPSHLWLILGLNLVPPSIYLFGYFYEVTDAAVFLLLNDDLMKHWGLEMVSEPSNTKSHGEVGQVSEG